MKPRIRLGFRDFWRDFDPLDNYFIDLLSADYDIEVCELSEKPDFLIYSCFGEEFRKYPGIRIFFYRRERASEFRGVRLRVLV